VSLTLLAGLLLLAVAAVLFLDGRRR